HIERGVAEADVTLAKNRAAVTEETIVGDSAAQKEGCFAEPHRQTAIRVGRGVQTVAFANQASKVGWCFLRVRAPATPNVIVGALRPEGGDESSLRQRLFAALGRIEVSGEKRHHA